MTKKPRALTAEREARKRLFKAALVYFDDTREAWAARHGISPSYVDHVRFGVRSSEKVAAWMDTTIQEFRQAVALEYHALSAAAIEAELRKCA